MCLPPPNVAPGPVRRKSVKEPSKIVRKSDSAVQVAGINFITSISDYSISTDHLNVALLKPISFLEFYEDLIFTENVTNVVELGMFQGGMSVFLTSLKDDLRYLGIDISSPVPGLRRFVDDHDEIARRVFTQHNVGQDDAGVPNIIAAFLEGRELDLIIDDASHQYSPSRRAFELCFPLLRPGGRYIIEDWGWLHWNGFEIPAEWRDSPALTNLVLELIMLCASRPELATKITVASNMVTVEKGNERVNGDFRLDSFIRMNRPKGS